MLFNELSVILGEKYNQSIKDVVYMYYDAMLKMNRDSNALTVVMDILKDKYFDLSHEQIIKLLDGLFIEYSSDKKSVIIFLDIISKCIDNKDIKFFGRCEKYNEHKNSICRTLKKSYKILDSFEFWLYVEDYFKCVLAIYKQERDSENNCIDDINFEFDNQLVSDFNELFYNGELIRKKYNKVNDISKNLNDAGITIKKVSNDNVKLPQRIIGNVQSAVISTVGAKLAETSVQSENKALEKARYDKKNIFMSILSWMLFFMICKDDCIDLQGEFV